MDSSRLHRSPDPILSVWEHRGVERCGMAKFETVCAAADILGGQSRMVSLNGEMIGVFNVRGEFLAISNECPHAGASLAHGNVENDVVSCRIHHWHFCLRSGQYLDEDKPEYDAKTYAIRVVDGDLQIASREDGE